KLVDDGHREKRCHQVHGADENGLHIAGHGVETTGKKNVIQVVENGVDAGKLVEHADRDGKKNRETVFVLEKRLRLCATFEVDRIDDLAQFGFGIRRAHHLQD